MTIENELKELMIRKSKSIRQFANEIEMPATTIQSMLNSGIENAGVKKVMRICDFLGIDTDALADGYIKEKQTDISGVTYNELSHIKKYRSLDVYGKEMIDVVLNKELDRVYDQAERRTKAVEQSQPTQFVMLEPPKVIPSYQSIASASAGTGQYVFDDLVPDLIEVDTDCKADFVIDVSGDSMQPTFYDGDGLLVKQQQSINLGDIGIFMIDGEAYVKEYGGDRLISHNNKYDDIILKENQDIRCIGKVLGKLE